MAFRPQVRPIALLTGPKPNGTANLAMKSDSLSFRIPDGVLCQELDKESVLLNLHTEQYYSLDPMGTRVWQLLTNTSSIDDAVKTMLTEYEVDETTLRRDVQDLVQKLVAKGLLVEQSFSGDASAS